MTKDRSLESKILDWLKKQGYPFEFAVGEMVSRAGWDVEYGRLYADPITGKTRELDIIASASYTSKEHASIVNFSLAIECKSSKDKPWVVFASEMDRWIGETAVSLFPGDLSQLAILEALPEDGNPWEIICFGPRVGHGITTAFSDARSGDPTTAYSALQGALAGAIAFSEEDERLLRSLEGARTSYLGLVLPVVVLDGLLFEYSLTESTPILEPTSLIRCVGPHPKRPGGATHVTIMTADMLEQHAAKFRTETAEIAERLHPFAGHIAADYLQSKQASQLEVR